MSPTMLKEPLENKGTAFSEEERDKFGLRGLLPPKVMALDQQKDKALAMMRSKGTDLEKYMYLSSIQEENETLFYRLVIDHLEEIMPLIYTPTVGEACTKFSTIFSSPRGLFISSKDKGHIGKILDNWPAKEVRVIVVTDGERILGLGDLGLNGMGIPIGKLSLYTACAGVHPRQTLPITIDVGTNNEDLHKDPDYLGLPQRRIRGKEYDELLEEFVTEANRRFPGLLLQFEDFGNDNAFKLLKRYRSRICCFNDDIQGTASVAFSGLLTALKLTKNKLKDQKILFVGAGEASLGIADLVVYALKKQGVSEEDARKNCWFIDSTGLVESTRDNLNEHKKPFAHKCKPMKEIDEVVKELKPNVLIGASGQPRVFTQKVIEEMASANESPIIFALSNPTSKAECTAEEAYKWSKGKAIFSSGSPFKPVKLEDGSTRVPGQGNNAYIFPGVGLGAIACASKHVDDEMFFLAASTLSDMVTEENLAKGCIYPPFTEIRRVSKAIAMVICDYAFKNNLALHTPVKDLGKHIDTLMYEPMYHSPSL